MGLADSIDERSGRLVRGMGSVIQSHDGKSEVSPYRLSAVFEKRNSRWLIMQYHGSEPA
ncbi:MAG: nuclear transport factor 2 family protein [Nitrososphaerota archaeon]|nr:nuclear transport factor 2 family protein [Nitrososphaerota archaeon]